MRCHIVHCFIPRVIWKPHRWICSVIKFENVYLPSSTYAITPRNQQQQKKKTFVVRKVKVQMITANRSFKKFCSNSKNPNEAQWVSGETTVLWFITFTTSVKATATTVFYLTLPKFSKTFDSAEYISIMVRVFANGPGDLGSIPGRVIPKTFKMVLDTSLLNTQHYKVRIKGKVEQSRERSSALPHTLL